MLLAWAQGRTGPLPGLALAAWLLTVFPVILRLGPRTVGTPEIIAAAIWGSVGIALIFTALRAWRPSAGNVRVATATLLWLGLIAVLLVLPSVLENAYAIEFGG